MSHTICALCGYTNDPGDPCICELKEDLWRVRFDYTPEERLAVRRKVVDDVAALRLRVRELEAEVKRLEARYLAAEALLRGENERLAKALSEHLEDAKKLRAVECAVRDGGDELDELYDTLSNILFPEGPWPVCPHERLARLAEEGRWLAEHHAEGVHFEYRSTEDRLRFDAYHARRGDFLSRWPQAPPAALDAALTPEPSPPRQPAGDPFTRCWDNQEDAIYDTYDTIVPADLYACSKCGYVGDPGYHNRPSDGRPCDHAPKPGPAPAEEQKNG